MSKIRNFKLKKKAKNKTRAEWGAGVLVFCRPCKDARNEHPNITLASFSQLWLRHSHLETRCLRQDSLSPLHLYFTMPDPQNLTSLSSLRSFLCSVLELKVKTLSPTWPPLPPAMLGLKRHELETGVLSAGIHALCRSILFSDLSEGQMYLQRVSQSLKVHFCLK